MLADWYYRYEHRVGFFAMVAGFAFDWFTLWRIDLLAEHILIITYLSICIITTVYLSLVEERSKQGIWWRRFYTTGLFVLQFALGGLFGRFLLFYTISGSIAGSWPFLLVLFAVLVANELSRHHYQRYVMRMSAFALALLSYSILLLPVLLARMSDTIFLFSVFASLVVFTFLNRSIMRFFPSFRVQRNQLISVVLVLYTIVTLLYFGNLIPPIPLSLKAGDVYHNVTRSGSDYVSVTEDYSWVAGLVPGKSVHIIRGAKLYYYSSVFAPTRLTAQITHQWQKWNEEGGKWQTISTIRFPVVGGSDGGYRGYSEKSNVGAGHYRVNIMSERGALIGRTNFEVVVVPIVPTLTTIKR